MSYWPGVRSSSDLGYERSALIWRLLGRLAYPAFRRFAPRADRWFRINSCCNGCGLCQKICPVHNIQFVEHRPDWQGHCEQCFACLHGCPQSAIEYIRSAGQPRYRHPDVTAADFCP